MTVGEVKRLLANVPDDYRFLKDHTYMDKIGPVRDVSNTSLEINTLNKAVVVQYSET